MKSIITQEFPNSPNYRETAKFNLWVKYFTDKANRETYLNATKSALKAYRTSSYSLAGVIGHNNIKKYKYLCVMIADIEGFGIGEFIRIAIAKALKGSYSDWEKLGMQLGYFENTDKKVTAVQNNFDLSNLGAAIERDRIARSLPY